MGMCFLFFKHNAEPVQGGAGGVGADGGLTELKRRCQHVPYHLHPAVVSPLCSHLSVGSSSHATPGSGSRKI